MNKNIKEKLKESKAMKILLLCFGVLFVGSVTAIWILGFSETTGLIVSGSPDITFSSNFSIDNLDNTNQTYSKIEMISIENNDGDMDFQILISEEVIDIEDECDPFSDGGDLNFTLSEETNGYPIEINNLDNITFENGETILTASTKLKKYACPQEISINVLINPI